MRVIIKYVIYYLCFCFSLRLCLCLCSCFHYRSSTDFFAVRTINLNNNFVYFHFKIVAVISSATTTWNLFKVVQHFKMIKRLVGSQIWKPNYHCPKDLPQSLPIKLPPLVSVYLWQLLFELNIQISIVSVCLSVCSICLLHHCEKSHWHHQLYETRVDGCVSATEIIAVPPSRDCHLITASRNKWQRILNWSKYRIAREPNFLILIYYNGKEGPT